VRDAAAVRKGLRLATATSQALELPKRFGVE